MSLQTTLLETKVAIVAGGGRGIGATTSKTLAEAGAAVAVVDIEKDRAENTAKEIEAAGGRAIPIVADLLESTQLERLVQQTVDAFGSVDVVANVAGGLVTYVKPRPMIEWSEYDWDQMLERNLRYVFLICKVVIKQMIKQGRGGSIVNISSISGVVSAINHSPYGAAKAGLILLSKAMAEEYGPYGIRVNAVSPGMILTPASAPSLQGLDIKAIETIFPLRRAGQPEDVARAVLFLASDLASYVTGQNLLVDGGASVKSLIQMPATKSS